jgi:hypothetical protein
MTQAVPATRGAARSAADLRSLRRRTAQLLPHGGGLRGARDPQENHVCVLCRGAPGMPFGGVGHADGTVL